MAAIVEAQNGEGCEEILKKIYSMTQDPSSRVRKSMCKALKVLLKVLPKKLIETQLVPEALKLVEDDSAEVLDSSLPFFCDLMDYCSFSHKEATIEAVKYSFFTFRKFMNSFRLCMDEEFRNICLK